MRKLAGEGTEEGTGVAREDKSGMVLLEPSKSGGTIHHQTARSHTINHLAIQTRHNRHANNELTSYCTVYFLAAFLHRRGSICDRF